MSRPRKHRSPYPAYVRIRHGSFVYKDKKLCRVSEGEAKLYEVLSQRKLLTSLDTVPAAVATFKKSGMGKLAVSSRAEHARLLDIFAEEFAEFGVDQVTAADIKQSALNLFPGKASAARAYKSRISTFFRWCMVDNRPPLHPGPNPCKEVWLDKPPKSKTKWTDDLFWRMRNLLSPMHQCYHDLSLLLYQRTTDIRRLRWSQIRGGVIHFEPTKTARSSGAAVDVPVTPEIQEVLDRALELARVLGPESYVIQTTAGTAYTATGISSAYERADAKLHTPTGAEKPERLGLNPKSLLPYAVTRAKRVLGYSLEQLKDARAHTSITTTEGYVQMHDTPVSQVRMTLPEKPK